MSDHFDGKKFFNPHRPKDHGFTDILKMLRSYRPTKWPKQVANTHAPSFPATLNPGEVATTFVNHATMLLQTDVLNILTDPVWAERASPVPFAGPKRVRKPGVAFDDLPKVDVILLSHNHYDHMDIETLQKLTKRDRPTIFTPLGNEAVLTKHGIGPVTELDWWETAEFAGLKITLTPAQHFSSRTPFDRNLALWGGFWVQNQDYSFYFAGDAGYSPHFGEIHGRLGAPDLALLPIGAYEPNWFMQPIHMNPEEAVRAHQDLQARFSVAIHFGTFQLTEEAIDDPAARLQKARAEARVDAAAFRVPNEGETVLFKLSRKSLG
jgi:L-ascorbate metabolism protein UlaG (beta-lactamase superfamily)